MAFAGAAGGTALPPPPLGFFPVAGELELQHLIHADPPLLTLVAVHRGDHQPEGNLDLRPAVTTCDAWLGPSPLAQGRVVGVGHQDEDAFQRPPGLPATDANTDRAEEEMFRGGALEVVHRSFLSGSASPALIQSRTR
jgi:hypothetical protein